jgi:hypothetical protein
MHVPSRTEALSTCVSFRRSKFHLHVLRTVYLHIPQEGVTCLEAEGVPLEAERLSS